MSTDAAAAQAGQAGAVERVALQLFICDFPAHESLARETWRQLEADLLPKRIYLRKAEALDAAGLIAVGGQEAALDTECDQCGADSWTCSGCGNHRDSWDWPTAPSPAL